MKNRFRFRVYDKYYKGYMQEGSIDIPKVFDGSSFIVEQCTGLKDCNGKLIYEGDIIRTKIETDNEYKQIIGEIVFWRLEWTIKTKSMFYPLSCAGKFSNGIKMPKQCDLTEIIGNIHETPELLKEID